MELPAELFAPRPNPDVDTTIRAIRQDVAFLTREKDHVARRGYARVLIAQLEHLLECPELLPPLVADGTVPDDDYWLAEAEITSRGLTPLGARPFDERAGGFFVEFLGRLSPCFAALPPDDGPFHGFAGTTVSVHRVEHTTTTPTARHFSDGEGPPRVGALAPRLKPPHAGAIRLFCDPRGYAPRGGSWQVSLAIASATDLPSAMAAADERSVALGIRLLVATCVRFVDNH